MGTLVRDKIARYLGLYDPKAVDPSSAVRRQYALDMEQQKDPCEGGSGVVVGKIAENSESIGSMLRDWLMGPPTKLDKLVANAKFQTRNGSISY